MDTENDEKEKSKLNVQASEGSTAIGEFSVGGDVSGSIQIGGTHQPTAAKTLQEFKAIELEELKAAIPEKMASLRSDVNAPSLTEKPYHLKTLTLNEGKYLLGRADLLNQLKRQIDLRRSTFLSGRAGVGRTSLLRAGLMPTLMMEDTLPVLVTIRPGEDLDLSIRRSILTRAESTTYLKGLKLAKFLEHTTESLAENKRLVLLLDGFENLFGGSAAEPTKEPERNWMQSFKSEWELTRSNQRLRWVFSIDQAFQARLSAFEPDDILEVAPLDRETAMGALVDPGQAGLNLDETDLSEILDELGKYRDESNGASINPAELQVVTWGLWERDRRRSASEIYREKEGVNGIFQQYLESTLRNHFIPELRPIAWQILTFLKDEYGKQSVAWGWLESRLETYGFETNKFPDAMRGLREQHLIRAKEENYELAHVNLKWGIQKWLNQQTLLKNARDEYIDQLNNIRASALRGMFGGALGFGLFRWIVGGPVRDITAVAFFTLQYAVIGGLSGLLFTLLIDIFIAQYKGAHPWQRYGLSAATGLITFGLGFGLFVFLNENLEDILPFIYSIIIGGAWGIVTGAGIAWAISSTKVAIWKIPVIAIAGALTFYLFHAFLPVLKRSPPTSLEILIGGFWFPFVILASVLFWKRVES